MSSSLQKKVVCLEIQLLQGLQQNRRNSIEVSGDTESVTEDNLEKKITEICSEINVNIGEADIVVFNWLPVRPKFSLQKKKKTVVAKFVNHKQPELTLSKNFILSSHGFNRFNI